MDSRSECKVEMLSSVIALCLVLLACVELGDAATAVDVYRLIQYDLAGIPFGSRLATLNHHASSSLTSPNADLSRTVLIIPIRDLNLSSVQDYIDRKQPLGGLLFLLSEDLSSEKRESKQDDDHNFEEDPKRHKLVQLERLLVHANVPYPVYFAFEDKHIRDVLADVKRNDAIGQPATATTGGYKFVVSTTEARKVSSPSITNIQGWLPGLKLEGDFNQIPTIAVVASYDTVGAAPALSVGSDSNGSGVVALLEIARLFSLLYSNPKTRGRYNLLFALTSGGPYNYNGTQKWLRSLDQRLRESIDYAICLNSIGSWDNELWLHVSKPPENAHIKQIFKDLSDTARALRVKVGLKHKKINISNPRVAWEHEQFSRLRVTAATLSELSSAPEFLENFGGLSDSRHHVSEPAIHRGVKLVAESLAFHGTFGTPELDDLDHLLAKLSYPVWALLPLHIDCNITKLFLIKRAIKFHRTFGTPELDDLDHLLAKLSYQRHIYGHEGKNIQIFAQNSSLAVNPSYITSWLSLLSQTPRVAPFLPKTDPLISALRKELAEHTAEVNVQHENLDGIFTFYDSTKATLNIYQVASVTFDLLLLLVLGSYLIVLFSFLVITTRGLDDLISLFRRPPSRKVKTA